MIISPVGQPVAGRPELRAASAASPDGVQLSPEATRALLEPGQPTVTPAWSYPHQTNLIGGSVLSQDGTRLFQSGYDRLFCLDTIKGGCLWEFPARPSSAAVVGPTGLVYVTADGKLHALDPITGKPTWSVEVPGGGAGTRPGPEGELLVTAGAGTVALHPSDGTIMWTSPISGPEVAVGKDGRMFAAGDGLKCVVGYDRDSGAEIWRKMHGHCRHRPAVGPDGTVYLGNVAGVFMALDPATGDIKWSYDTGSHILESPTVAPDGTVYAGNLAGKLFAFDPVKRGKKWEAEVGAEVRQPPGIGGDGTVLLASDRNVVLGFEPEHGGKLWSEPAASYVHCTPVSDRHGQVYFGANNATLYSLKTPALRLQLDDLARLPASHDAPGLGYSHGRLIVGQSALPLRSPDNRPT
ncbi:MAG: hypothetical protein AMXMBFR33_32030 [Candidatus Xenobia bacterium]